MRLQTVLSFTLITLSFAPMLQEDGLFYTAVSVALQHFLSVLRARLAMPKTNAAVRRLLLASIVYLPIVFVLMVLGRI